MIVQEFKDRLKEAMKLREINITELANRTSVGKSAISGYLKGEYKAKQGVIDELARVLRVSPVWLMGFDVPREPSALVFDEHTASDEYQAEAARNNEKGYYNDPEVAALAEEARTNPQIRVLLSASKNLSKSELDQTIKFIKFLRSQEKNDSDFSE